MADSGFIKRLKGIIGDFDEGFRKDYGMGSEDSRRVMYRTRDLEGKTAEGPKMSHMAGAYPMGQRVRDISGTASEAGKQARAEANMSFEKNRSLAHQMIKYSEQLLLI